MLRPGSSDTDSPPVSKTHQYKKITKPLLERKRRARMNRCYDDLKDIMTGCLHSEGENISKLEKADILELTLRHLKKLTEAGRSPVEAETQFRQGYTSCVQEATQFLLSLPGVDIRLGQRLVSHLMTGPPPPPPPPPPPLQRLESPPPPPPPPPAPALQTLIQQRMLSSLMSLAPPSLGPWTHQPASEPVKPRPVKPSAIRAGKPSPGSEVWKPYS